MRRLLGILRRPRRQTLICAECELSGGPFEAAEAEHLRALHAQLHHGVMPTQPQHTLGPFA